MRGSPANVERLRAILRRFERVQKVLMESNDCCRGLTTTQCHPLLEIDRAGHTNLKDLAVALGVTSSTLSRTVDGLVREGLVDRKLDEADRRRVVLMLTKSGKELCDDINRRNDALYRRVLDQLPKSFRGRTVSALDDLVSAIEETVRGDPECCADDTKRAVAP